MEFGMKQPNSFSGGSNVEWYSSGTAGAYNPSSYQYAPPPTAAASAYSNSFEDEPPLLEGQLWCSNSAIYSQSACGIAASTCNACKAAPRKHRRCN